MIDGVQMIAFQSTPLREGRPGRGFRVRLIMEGFNPRPCARGDGELKLLQKADEMFQSTPLREGRPIRFYQGPIDYLLFQSTPLREGRHTGQHQNDIPLVFQSTPLREGRRYVP